MDASLLEKYRCENVFIAIATLLHKQMRYYSKYKNDKNLKPRKADTNEDEDVFRCGILKLYHILKSLYRL